MSWSFWSLRKGIQTNRKPEEMSELPTRVRNANQQTINDISDALKASTAHWPFVCIQAGSLSVDVDEHNVASDIEDRVDAGCNEGQGCSRDGRVHYITSLAK
jgi:hypothetical protein